MRIVGAMSRVSMVALLFVACTAVDSTPRVPVERFLIHVWGPWQYPPPELRRENPTRTAPAAIVRLSADGRSVEHWCSVIEGPRKELHISDGDGHTIALGRWTVSGNAITVTREKVFRTVRLDAEADPLCSATTYIIDGSRLRAGEDVFTPTTHYRGADWDRYAGFPEQTC